jgi:hypothetical protein
LKCLNIPKPPKPLYTDGWTALLWALNNGHDEAAQALIEGGASLEVKSHKGRSARDLVKRLDSSRQAKILSHQQLEQPMLSPTSTSSSEQKKDVKGKGLQRSMSSLSVRSEGSDFDDYESSFVAKSERSDGESRVSVDEYGLFEEVSYPKRNTSEFRYRH